ncbi:MAG: selenide, water dikinase SelD [Actinobacteria bacterium]|nr:selenide, water dikinase SelD [Actinomycetota bacterium]
MAQVLRHLQQQGSGDPNLLLGLDAPDDAAIYRISGDVALVQTVDFFTPVVDDAYTWGAIAATNALSDVYAMGAEPATALNLVAWPMDLDLAVLAQVLRGGADKCEEAGVSIIGGHTVDDKEPKYGLAVTGFVKPDDAIRLSTAKPGMDLVLTKPIGTGIISTAIKRSAIDDDATASAVASMQALNRPAALAMREIGYGPHAVGAATDVTGYGLMGHLQNMVSASGVGAEIYFDRVPMFEGVRDLAAKGMVPGGTRRNFDFFSDSVEVIDELDRDLELCLYDAQTSGGMLIAVDSALTSSLIESLLAKHAVCAVHIGVITGSEQMPIRLRRAV